MKAGADAPSDKQRLLPFVPIAVVFEHVARRLSVSGNTRLVNPDDHSLTHAKQAWETNR